LKRPTGSFLRILDRPNKPSDRRVNLAGKTYEFHVDPQGAFLTLKESDSRAERPT
jgi:hypothetical protein